MNIEFDSYKQKLNDIKPALDALADSLNLEGLRNELERLHAMQEAPGFWDDPEKSQKIVVKIKHSENKIERYEAMQSSWEDLLTICEMAEEEDDDSMLPELKEGFQKLAEEMETCRLETLLTGKFDKNNAMMSFQSGAGGTEAQDWCQMLYRMYTRWAERHGFTYKIMDYQEGDEAGLKSASIMIEGVNAYGFLKGESGVHRLVRVSPFDANARRLVDQTNRRRGLIDMLTACTGGTEHLHFVILGLDLEILGIVLDFRNDLDRRERSLPAGVGVKR